MTIQTNGPGFVGPGSGDDTAIIRGLLLAFVVFPSAAVVVALLMFFLSGGGVK